MALSKRSCRGPWFWQFAEQLERQQWEQFEVGFRAFHEQSLAYRFLPETDEERAIVVKSFPPLTIPGKKGSLELSCDKVHYSAWPDPLSFSEIGRFTLQNDTLIINYVRNGKQNAKIPVKTFGKLRQQAINTINQYYGRYMSAIAYQKQKQEEERTAEKT
jgi:hypothetical protein